MHDINLFLLFFEARINLFEYCTQSRHSLIPVMVMTLVLFDITSNIAWLVLYNAEVSYDEVDYLTNYGLLQTQLR